MFSYSSLKVLIFLPQAKDLIITPATTLKEKPDPHNVVFGTVFTDHMLTIEWSSEAGWDKPHIKPFQNLSLHPSSSALHYAVEVSAQQRRLATWWLLTVGLTYLPLLQQLLGSVVLVVFTQGSNKCL